jgi:hypothetical protein
MSLVVHVLTLFKVYTSTRCQKMPMKWEQKITHPISMISKAGSDSGNIEMESVTGSLQTKARIPAPPDMSSEGSNSDVKICLDGHGLNDSTMCLSCAGNTSFISKLVFSFPQCSVLLRYPSEANWGRLTGPALDIHAKGTLCILFVSASAN